MPVSKCIRTRLPYLICQYHFGHRHGLLLGTQLKPVTSTSKHAYINTQTALYLSFLYRNKLTWKRERPNHPAKVLGFINLHTFKECYLEVNQYILHSKSASIKSQQRTFLLDNNIGSLDAVVLSSH